MSEAERLNALADRVEGLAVLDRELEAEIILALDHPAYRFPKPVLNRKPDSHVEALERHRWDGFDGFKAWPSILSSLDAALTRMPKRWFVNSISEFNQRTWSVTLRSERTDEGRGYVGSQLRHDDTGCATPAFALVAAILRALALEPR